VAAALELLLNLMAGKGASNFDRTSFPGTIDKLNETFFSGYKSQ